MNATTEIEPAPQAQSTTLYYREGSSDKVYQAAIEPAGDLFLVTFAFGRRGSTLSTGTKTPEPVNLDTATRIFTKLVREKKAKGYTEGPEAPLTSTRPRKIVSPASSPNCSTPSPRTRRTSCSKMTVGQCRRSLTAAECWSGRTGQRSTASTARACSLACLKRSSARSGASLATSSWMASASAKRSTEKEIEAIRGKLRQIQSVNI